MQKSSRVLPWQWGAWPFEKVSTYTLTNEDSKKLELCSGGQVPCRAGFPHYGSGLGIHLYQCTSWHSCERLHLASVIFFFLWKTLWMHLHISWWVIYEYTFPHHTECSALLDQKMAWPLCSILPIYPILSQVNFFCFPTENSPQREKFCPCRRSETKNSRSTKRHPDQQVEKLFWAVEKNISMGVLHQMESTWKVTEV